MDPIKLLLGVGAAYLVYNLIESQANANAATNTTPAAPGGISPAPSSGGTVSTPTMAATVPVPSLALRDSMLRAKSTVAPTDITLNWHQWNYIYNVATGKQGLDPQTAKQGDGNAPLTLDQWLTEMNNSGGLSGLGRTEYAVPTPFSRRENRTGAEQAFMRFRQGWRR